MDGNRRRRARGPVLAAGLALLLGSTGFFLLRYRVYAVPTASMSPLITPGDRVVADTWSQHAARGDVVLLDGGNLLVKRVAAVAGDTVTCCDASGHITSGPVTIGAGTTPFTVRVNASRLFLLGDNPAASLDSRAAASTPSPADGDGTVPASQVRGRAVAVLSPTTATSLPGRAAAGLTVTAWSFATSLLLLAAAALLSLTTRRP
jgi:signal peptidase I